MNMQIFFICRGLIMLFLVFSRNVTLSDVHIIYGKATLVESQNEYIKLEMSPIDPL